MIFMNINNHALIPNVSPQTRYTDKQNKCISFRPDITIMIKVVPKYKVACCVYIMLHLSHKVVVTTSDITVQC